MQSFKTIENENHNIENQAPDYIFAESEDMNIKSFKIDHDLDEFDAIDLGTLGISEDYIHEHPKVELAPLNNEINYPSFQNELPVEVKNFVGQQDNLNEKNLIYVNPNDEEQIRNLEDKGLIKNIFSMSQKQLRFVLQENTLYVIDPSVIGTNSQQLDSISQLKLPSPDANFQYLQVDQLRKIERGKDIYEAMEMISPEENQGQIVNKNDIMNQYFQENNIVYHDETVADSYALNPNVRPISDLQPISSYFTGDQDTLNIQTIPMMGVIIGIVSIILILKIGVAIGQARNAKLEKDYQKKIEDQEKKIKELQQMQTEKESLQSGFEETSDQLSARFVQNSNMKKFKSSQFEEMKMSIQGEKLKTKIEGDNGPISRNRIQSDDNFQLSSDRLNELGISKKHTKSGPYSHDNNSLRPNIIWSANKEEQEKSNTQDNSPNFISNNSSVVESPEEQIDTNDNEIIIDDAQIITDQSNIFASGKSKVVQMVESSKEIKDTIVISEDFETPPRLRASVPQQQIDEAPVSPEPILTEDEPDVVEVEINQNTPLVEEAKVPDQNSQQLVRYSKFDNFRQIVEQMKNGTMTGIPKAQIEKMLSPQFLSQIEPKRADLQEIGFDVQRQEMFVQQVVYYDAPLKQLSPRGQKSIEGMSSDKQEYSYPTVIRKYSNGRPRYDAQQLCLPPCEPKEFQTPQQKCEDDCLMVTGTNELENIQSQSLMIPRSSGDFASSERKLEEESEDFDRSSHEENSLSDSGDVSEDEEESKQSDSSDSQSSSVDSESSEENETTQQSQIRPRNPEAQDTLTEDVTEELEASLLMSDMPPISMESRSFSEISDESPLHNILDTGRFQKKFKDIDLIGQGGFGKVYKATYHVDQKQYAVKVVRLYIQKAKGVDPMKEIYQHRVYRELQAASAITSENIVRYFSSWFEELNPDERQAEVEYRAQFQEAMAQKKLEKKNHSLTKKKNNNSATNQSMSDSPPFKMASSLKKKSRRVPISVSSVSSSSDSHSSYFRKSLRKLSFGKRKPLHEQSIAKSIIQHKTLQIVHDDIEGENDTENELNKTTSFEAKNEQQIQAEKSRITQFSSNECKKKNSSQYSTLKRSKSPETVSMISSEISDSVSRENSKKMNKKRSMSADKLEEIQDESSSEEDSSSEESSSSEDSSSESSSSEEESSQSKSSASIQSKEEQKSIQVRSLKIKKSTKRFIEKFVKSKHEESSKSSAISGYSQFSQSTLCNFLEKQQDFYSVNMMIQMEYCSGQSLENFLNKRNFKGKSAFDHEGGCINRSQNLEIFKHMVNGIAEIHKNNVLHRDLKPENIFINVEGHRNTAKIGDFGLARMLNSGSSQDLDNANQDPYMKRISLGSINKSQSIFSQFSSVAGTQAYMAPEIKTHFEQGTRPPKHRDVQINKSQDIYQLGLILYELSHKVSTHHLKTMLFRQLLESRSLQGPIKQGDIEFEMIMKMTDMDPSKRPTCEELQRDYLPKWEQQLKSEHNRSKSQIQPQEADKLDEEKLQEQFLQLSLEEEADNNYTERAEVKPRLQLQSENDNL